MTRKEYETELHLLEEMISSRKIEEKHLERLEELYNYKPVSMKWFVLKCKVLMLQGAYEEVITRYKDRVNKDSSYVENLEIWEQIIEAYKLSGFEVEGKRQNYMFDRLKKGSSCEEISVQLNSVKQKMIEGDETQENLAHLEELYYISNQKLMAYIVYLYSVRLYPNAKTEDKEKTYINLDNMEYFTEYIQDKRPVIIVSQDHISEDDDILAYVLHRLDVPVHMIGNMVNIEGDYRLIDSVQVSMENAQSYEDCIVIPPIRKMENGQSVGDNIPYLIDYLCKNEMKNDFALTIASNKEIEYLRTHKDISKRFERLSGYEARYLEDEIGFARAGSYYEHISRLYGYDVKQWLQTEPECDFSIVVPARNATETLYYTLKTCLEQEYNGTYEVVVSDNSTNGHSEVYDTCQRLNDKRIKYYKTPRDLNLAKSFEYAYFQTKGEFIIPLGADDAILPWALETLKQVLKDNTFAQVDIISWMRGFYAWPGFNGGQENQFVIPGYFEKSKKVASYDNSMAYLKAAIKNPQNMYVLPNLYINSGFKREYLGKMCEKSGYILDGWAQDIYTGLTNLAIGATCLRIEYPITIAGMSASSVGSISKKASGGENVAVNKTYEALFGGKGMYNYVEVVDRIPTTHFGTDVSGMYRSIGRLVAKKMLPSNFYTEEDLKQIYINCYNSISIVGDKYTQYILEGLELARTISEDFTMWYQQEILVRGESISYISKEVLEKSKSVKTYREGYYSGGGVVLDAARYGVTNIYEAVRLFKEFLGF